jgi:serine/threonine protein kinase
MWCSGHAERMSERVRVVHDGDGTLAAVKAPPPADPDRTRREIALLRVLRHPGVVELLADRERADGAELWTRWVGSRSTADLPTPLDPDLAAGLALAVGSTLQDLHRLGVAHTALDPTHVLLDPQGRPVLCGFGGAATVGAPLPPDDLGLERDGTAEATLDVAGLGELLAAWLGQDPDHATTTEGQGSPRRPDRRRRPSGQVRRLLGIADQARHPDPSDRPGLRAVLDALRAAAPGTGLGPGADMPATTPPNPRRTGDAVMGIGTAEGPSPTWAPTETAALAEPTEVRIDAPVVGPAGHDPAGWLPEPDDALLDAGDRGMWDELHGLRPSADDLPADRTRWRAGAAASVAALAAFVVVSGALTWPSGGDQPDPAALDVAAPATSTPSEHVDDAPPTTRATATTTSTPTTTSPPSPSPPSTLAATTGAAPVVVHEDRRYQVGVAGDLAVVGDWRCDGGVLVAVYRPSSGSVFVFESWPRPGERVESTAVTVATSGSAVTADARTDGCVDLVVSDGDTELARFGPEDLG